MPDTRFSVNFGARSQISSQFWCQIPDFQLILVPDPRFSGNFAARSWIFRQFRCWIPDFWSLLVPDPGFSVNFSAGSQIFTQFRCQIPDFWSILVPDPGFLVDLGAGSWIFSQFWCRLSAPAMESIPSLDPSPSVHPGARSRLRRQPGDTKPRCHRPRNPVASPKSVTVTRRHREPLSAKKPGVTLTQCHPALAVSPSPCHTPQHHPPSPATRRRLLSVRPVVTN